MRGNAFKVVTGVALSVALVVSLFPVPSGSPLLDRRYEEAEAVAPAVAAITVFGTALAAYGVYAAGTSSDSYNANLQSLYDGCLEASGMAADAFSGMLTNAVNAAGNINLGALTSGFFPVLRDYIAAQVSSGDLVVGANSKSAGHDVIFFGTHAFTLIEDVPFRDEALVNLKKLFPYSNTVSNITNDLLCEYLVLNGEESGRAYFSHLYLYTDNIDDKYFNLVLDQSLSTGYCLRGPRNNQNNAISYYGCRKIVYEDGQVKWQSVSGTNAYLYADMAMLIKGFPYECGNGYTVSDSWLVTSMGTVTDAVASNTAVVPDNVVEPFEPDAGTLENGWDSTAVVDAISANTGTVEGIGNQLEGVDGTLNEILDTIFPWTASLEAILSAVNPLAAILTGVQSLVNSGLTISGVVTGVQSSPFSWLQTWWNSLTGWWASLLAWIGATPIGTHIGNVVTGIGNVTSGIGDVVGSLDDVVGAIGGLVGVNDATTWWGTLSGWWEGLLDWVGSTPIGELVGSVVRGISGVIDGISTGVTTLSADLSAILSALDGVLAGEVTFKLPEFPQAVPLYVDGNSRRSLEQMLGSKAPFAYVTAVKDGISELSYSTLPKFRVQKRFEFLGIAWDVDLNAEPWLLADVGGTTIAGLLRTNVSLVLSMGLLYAAYKIGLKALGVGD